MPVGEWPRITTELAAGAIRDRQDGNQFARQAQVLGCLMRAQGESAAADREMGISALRSDSSLA